MSEGLPARLPPLAVIDWGIGGFGLVSSLLAKRSRASFVYVSDTGFTPYGRVPGRELAGRVANIARALVHRGVEHIVIACNAASTIASIVRGDAGVQVTDMITHGIAMGARARGDRIGVVGGARTIRSGAYRTALVAHGKSVFQRIAQPLSARIERGDLDSPELVAEVARIVGPLRGLPAMVLACTHYPAIRERFAEQLPGTELLDPVDGAVLAVLGVLDDREKEWTAAGNATARVVITTGEAAATRSAASRAFGYDPGEVQRVRLDAFVA